MGFGTHVPIVIQVLLNEVGYRTCVLIIFQNRKVDTHLHNPLE
jgi:hypothetical protein